MNNIMNNEPTNITKTPRTDKVFASVGENILDHARQLETELDAKTGIVEALEEEVEQLHNLLIRCGEAVGKEAYTCDDGTTQQDVLVAKVPELVRKLAERRGETADLISDIMRDEVNVTDECEKWLRAYAPEKLRQAYKTEPAAYPPPESEWPEKPAPPEGCVWVRQPDEGATEQGDISLLDNEMGSLQWEVNPEGVDYSGTPVFRPVAIDHTEGGKYRMLEEGEPVERDDEYFWHDRNKWAPVENYVGMPFTEAFWGSLIRRPVQITSPFENPQVREDYAAKAKEILQSLIGCSGNIRSGAADKFVDLILKAAKQ